jgi:hypothetical protein
VRARLAAGKTLNSHRFNLGRTHKGRPMLEAPRGVAYAELALPYQTLYLRRKPATATNPVPMRNNDMGSGTVVAGAG